MLGCCVVIEYIGQMVLAVAGGGCGLACCDRELLVPQLNGEFPTKEVDDRPTDVAAGGG